MPTTHLACYHSFFATVYIRVRIRILPWTGLNRYCIQPIKSLRGEPDVNFHDALLQNIISLLKMYASLLFGFTLYILSHVSLLPAAPQKGLLLLILYTLPEAPAYAIIIPRRDAFMPRYRKCVQAFSSLTLSSSASFLSRR